MVSGRSVGWMRYLYRSVVDPGGQTTDPIGSHLARRVEACFAPGLLARRTPAWTEGYVAVLDRLIEGLRAGGPDAVGPEADEPADRAGPLLVALGIRALVASDDRRNDASPDGDRERGSNGHASGTHSSLAQRVSGQWAADPGCYRSSDGEVHPADLALVGLGLRLYDTRHGTALHRQAFEPWWAETGRHLADRAAAEPRTDTLSLALLLAAQGDGSSRSPSGEPASAATSADPHTATGPLAGSGVEMVARHLFDTVWPELAPELEAAASGAGLAPDAGHPAAWLLAREWGLAEQADLARAGITTAWSPGPDGDTDQASWPEAVAVGADRGARLAALAAAAEATGPGAWWQLANQPAPPCHQVVGVDVPTVILHRAEWVHDCLCVGLSPWPEDPKRWTAFRITGAEPRMWYLTGVDGASMDTAGAATVVRVPLVRGALEFAPGSY